MILAGLTLSRDDRRRADAGRTEQHADYASQREGGRGSRRSGIAQAREQCEREDDNDTGDHLAHEEGIDIDEYVAADRNSDAGRGRQIKQHPPVEARPCIRKHDQRGGGFQHQSNLHETGFDNLHAGCSRVFRVSKPGQHFVGRHDITELLDDVFQSAPMLVVR